MVELEGGGAAFVKTRAGAEAGEYESEAAGLRWLDECESVQVPEVLAASSEPPFLALRWIEPGRLSDDGAEQLGRGLAELHALGAPAHGSLPGAARRQRLGSLPLESEPEQRWADFYSRQRLIPLARLAAEAGSLDRSGVQAVEAIAARIDELAGPQEPPARLHGDLWSGNVHADPEGRGWLIDPAAQGGHREMDLAMLRLFGSPSDRLFAAYEEAAPLAAGHVERVSLWQLQPLLVHAILFGGHYGAAAERAARTYL